MNESDPAQEPFERCLDLSTLLFLGSLLALPALIFYRWWNDEL